MNFRQLLISLQKWSLTHQSLLKSLFVLLEICALIAWLGAVTVFIIFPYQDMQTFNVHNLLYSFGSKMGVVSLGLYLLTLMPGIIKRVGWQPMLGAILMPYRRHVGISMFLCAIVHMSITTSLPFLLGGSGLYLTQSKVFGLMTLLILFPLWLTSNDPSQKYLGKYWKMLHRLTYVAVLLIFLHTAFMHSNWMIPTVMVLVLEAFSWVIVWMRPQTAAPISPPPMVK